MPARRRPTVLFSVAAVLRSGTIVVATLVSTVTLFSAPSCAPPPEHRPIEMAPIGTWQGGSSPARDDASDSGVTAPNSATAPARSGRCGGRELDALDELLRQCEAPMPRAAEVVSLKDKLEVTLVASPPRVTPGGHVEVEVTLKNKSSDELTLWFSGDPAPRFDVEAIDAKGRRADLPATKWPGYPKGTKPEPRDPRAARIALEKNGTARVRVAWDATKAKWAPQLARTWEGRGYPRVAAGPLPAGKYTLRLVLPLLGDLDVPKLSVEVGS